MEREQIIFEILKSHTDNFNNIELLNQLSDGKDESLMSFDDKVQKILEIIDSVGQM